MSKTVSEDLTEEIKRKTGYFDLSVLTCLSLKNKKLSGLKGISDCCNLAYLDLSGNNLTYLHMIKDMTKIKFLDLSFNKIVKLDDLSGLKNLEKLKLEGNQISSIKQVYILKKLPNLKYLSLKSQSLDDANPVCNIDEYRKLMIENFPQLIHLDYIQLGKNGNNLENEITNFTDTFHNTITKIKQNTSTLKDKLDYIKEKTDTKKKTQLKVEGRLADMECELSKMNVLANEINSLFT